MAVATPDIALGDLGGEDRDAEAVANQLHDAVTLRRTWAVVEVEHTNIGNSAIHARVLAQVLGDKGDAPFPLGNRASPDDRDVMLAIASVVRTRRLAVAFATDLLQPVRAGGLPVEICEWSKLLAGAAPLLCRRLPP
ncbi:MULTISPECIES: hypothetical protein [Microbacterium]|uniref:hypothetical protein n=1 Tax=Microbacterium TaxID=33882 RepID=UPI00217E87C3|nr:MULTISPECIES: hypothetical protein [Microbacterium]UWF77083.1 hypothetical protein JSY13_09760 [Microbacterium neungamense]WCM55243.1 hypothetical protein JRG78_09770 [Microbacterium sp. EF45047]